jgi:hypothetical protein
VKEQKMVLLYRWSKSLGVGFLGRFLIAVQIIVFIFLSDILVVAEQFRMDNEITSGKFVVRSKTYFLDDDFLGVIEDNGEMTYYNAARDTFTLLAPSLRIQTQLSASETRRVIDATLDGLRFSKTEIEPRYEFVANPVFKTALDNKSGQLALQSNWVDYKMTTEIFTDNNIAKRYFDFCNITCYLNYRVTNSHRQLYRLEVNRVLRKENRFPQNITAIFYPNGKTGKTEETISSSHKLIRRLTDEDKNKINMVQNSINKFKTVKFNDYQELIINQISPNKNTAPPAQKK